VDTASLIVVQILTCNNSFVCSVNAVSTQVELLRSYKSQRIGHVDYDCYIWEAVRATSAAPLFFEPITLFVDSKTPTFIDRGVRANNPIHLMASEAYGM
jgi:patatin-like phospholipase/acyl hydrolase